MMEVDARRIGNRNRVRDKGKSETHRRKEISVNNDTERYEYMVSLRLPIRAMIRGIDDTNRYEEQSMKNLCTDLSDTFRCR